jgi:hypothetical protein
MSPDAGQGPKRPWQHLGPKFTQLLSGTNIHHLQVFLRRKIRFWVENGDGDTVPAFTVHLFLICCLNLMAPCVRAVHDVHPIFVIYVYFLPCCRCSTDPGEGEQSALLAPHPVWGPPPQAGSLGAEQLRTRKVTHHPYIYFKTHLNFFQACLTVMLDNLINQWCLSGTLWMSRMRAGSPHCCRSVRTCCQSSDNMALPTC